MRGLVPRRSSMKRTLRTVVVAVGLSAAVASSLAAGGHSAGNPTPVGYPIKHVVVIFQENNSFDHLLGKLCVDEDNRCDGTMVGKLSNGDPIPLRLGGDIVPGIAHSVSTMRTAINGGGMDGWDHIPQCTEAAGYNCFEVDDRSRVPTLSDLADQFVISDRTFQLYTPSSWGAHLDLVSADLDGFTGDNPDSGFAGAKGWGCDSGADAPYKDTSVPGAKRIMVPACIPDRQGNGPYRASPVKYVPTIMDRLQSAGRSWKIYAPVASDKAMGYGRAICPTFYSCLGSSQAKNFVRWDNFVPDAEAGKLPNFSIVVPMEVNSQHNWDSLMAGDNWIASLVGAAMSDPEQWKSTAIFITYDDCGCFYDHVLPPKGMGIRLPMVIVSPYAKPGFVDSNIASFASILAFTERLYGLRPLNKVDAGAYDYFKSFDFSQQPLPPIDLPQHVVPRRSLWFMRTHPPNPYDPT
jgi:phospholipase C